VPPFHSLDLEIPNKAQMWVTLLQKLVVQVQKYFDEMKSNNFDYNAFEIIAKSYVMIKKRLSRGIFPNIPIGIPIVNNSYDIFINF
jgi:hypothetical protein